MWCLQCLSALYKVAKVKKKCIRCVQMFDWLSKSEIGKYTCEHEAESPVGQVVMSPFTAAGICPD